MVISAHANPAFLAFGVGQEDTPLGKRNAIASQAGRGPLWIIVDYDSAENPTDSDQCDDSDCREYQPAYPVAIHSNNPRPARVSRELT